MSPTPIITQPQGTYIAERMDEFAGFEIFGFADEQSPQWGQNAPGWAVVPISWFFGLSSDWWGEWYDGDIAQNVTYTKTIDGSQEESGVDFSMCPVGSVGWNWMVNKGDCVSTNSTELISSTPTSQTFNQKVFNQKDEFAGHMPSPMTLRWRLKQTPPYTYGPSPGYADATVAQQDINELNFQIIPSVTPQSFGPFTVNSNFSSGVFYNLISDFSFTRPLSSYFDNGS